VLDSKSDEINQTVGGPRLKLSEIRERSMTIHEGGDNYCDQADSGGDKGKAVLNNC
jgi:Cu/Zn superoxide dismutase